MEYDNKKFMKYYQLFLDSSLHLRMTSLMYSGFLTFVRNDGILKNIDF